jgi:hypothetical protein
MFASRTPSTKSMPRHRLSLGAETPTHDLAADAVSDVPRTGLHHKSIELT